MKRFRYPLQRYTLQEKSRNTWTALKREFTEITQKFAKENANDSKLSSYIIKFGFGGCGITAVCIWKSRNQVVVCREARKISDIKASNKLQPAFEWKKLFKYLYPHIWYLLLALSVSTWASCSIRKTLP